MSKDMNTCRDGQGAVTSGTATGEKVTSSPLTSSLLTSSTLTSSPLTSSPSLLPALLLCTLSAAGTRAQDTLDVEPVFDAPPQTQSLFGAPAPPAVPALAAQEVPPSIIELDRIVAVVNNDVIISSELGRRFRMIEDQLRQAGTEAPPRNVLIGQVLERLIVENLQLQLAKELGVRVDDQLLSRTIDDIARQNQLTVGQFREVLAAEGFDFAQFREDIRNELLVARLQERQVASRVQISETDIDNFLAGSNAGFEVSTEYRLGHILIAVPEAASAEQIATAKARAEETLATLHGGADFATTAAARSDGQQALSGGDLGWRAAAELPAIFADAVFNMSPGDLSPLIRSPSGFHIVKLADLRGTQDRSVVEQTRVRHILVRTNSSTTSDDARARLEQLRTRVLNGENFGDLARAHSDDTGTATRGGELGWVTREKVVPRFFEAMRSLQQLGQISPPFQTEFGWHVVQLLERRKHDDTDEVRRANAAEQLRRRRIDEELQNWVRQLRDEAYVEYRLDE
ncbi:MAG: peptidylprolyl isomerase [Gammaproteobacteria bacterium]